MLKTTNQYIYIYNILIIYIIIYIYTNGSNSAVSPDHWITETAGAVSQLLDSFEKTIENMCILYKRYTLIYIMIFYSFRNLVSKRDFQI